jgi:hypothetical protein
MRRFLVGIPLLRIIVTALSLSAALLFVLLWVVSYWRLDGVVCHWIPHKYVMALSLCGELGVVYGHGNETVPEQQLDWEESPHYPGVWINRGRFPRLTGRRPPFHARFHWHHVACHWYVGAPYWFLVAMAVALGVAPWLGSPRRYSLRTLLIVTALAALLLTGVVYSGFSDSSY